MRRKHHRQAARILKQSLRLTLTIDEIDSVAHIADVLATLFARHNAKFDRQSFMDDIFRESA
ncbi:hypothetical protein ACIGXM_14040 [Kitasatospora sp. NPDC052896]|uniref:hypothetical protein n=1 Tax=Kitasatospora sp. NPDC052896 TaxID=3364061 RepID=UPI0037C6FA29